jgi:hypothetical protein
MSVQNDQLTVLASGTKINLDVKTVGCDLQREGTSVGQFIVTFPQPIEESEIIVDIQTFSVFSGAALDFLTPTTARITTYNNTSGGFVSEVDFCFSIKKQANGVSHLIPFPV